jgi:LuxR family transcriptional regulator, quorum-sensing system regulator CviR
MEMSCCVGHSAQSRTTSKKRTGIISQRSHKRLRSLISGKEAITLLEIIHASLSCNTESGFIDLFAKLKDLFLFEFAVSGLAKLDQKGIITSYDTINVNYPDEWLRLYKESNFHKVDAIAEENFSTFSPQFWSDTYKKRPQPRSFLSAAESFGLQKGYAHGSSPFGRWKEGSIFSFSSRSMNNEARIVTILTLIVPHLHRVLSNILNASPSRYNMNKLSPREKEVLNWLKYGKSSWEISVILSISERTVNFHIYNVFQKLEVVNRSQAVAAAAFLGLIDLD